MFELFNPENLIVFDQQVADIRVIFDVKQITNEAVSEINNSTLQPCALLSCLLPADPAPW